PGKQPGRQVVAGGGDGRAPHPLQVLALTPKLGRAFRAGLYVLRAAAALAPPCQESARTVAPKATQQVSQLTHGAVQRMPAMRGILSRGLRDCLVRGSRCASFSRSMVRPRWMRDLTVPSLTPRASATSS